MRGLSASTFLLALGSGVLVTVSAYAQVPTGDPRPDCILMAAVAERAALARDLGRKQDEVLAAAAAESPKLPPERLRRYAGRVFEAPVPAYLAAAEAYTACLANWSGIGSLSLTQQRIDSLATCAQNVTPGGAVACGYAEIAARSTRTRASRPVPSVQEVDALVESLERSLVVVETSEDLGLGVVAPGGGFVVTRMVGLQRGQEVALAPAGTSPGSQSARVVGADPTTDIAVIEPPPPNVPPVALVDPHGLDIGHPLIGLPWTEDEISVRLVTLANTEKTVARVLGRAECWPRFVEVIAEASAPALSGPIFDLDGRLVTFGAVYYRPKRPVPLYPNFGYAAATILEIAERVRRYGYWKRGSMGLAVQEVTTEEARALGLKEPEGALVHKVDPGSPAAKAGIRPKDVILAINGERLKRSCQLPGRSVASLPGDVLTLTVQRRKKQLTIGVTVQQARRTEQQAGQ